MESNKNLLMNKAMFWGLIIGLTSMIVTTIYYATDNMFTGSETWVSIAIFVAGIVLATLAYKKSIDQDTPFPYSKALGLGVATMFFASIILAVFTFVLYKFIDPELIEQMYSTMEEKYLSSGLSEDMIEQQIEMQRKIMTPAVMSIAQIFTGVLYGLVISLITSIFLKKKPESGFESAMHEIDEKEMEIVPNIEKNANIGLLVIGYIFALLGGLIGIFIGQYLKGKIKLQDGSIVYRFDESSRKHGKTIYIIASICFTIGAIIYFYNIGSR